jgi:hypothetical protein
MTEKELYALVDNAEEGYLRNCLKCILISWFVEDHKANFDKKLGADTIEEVTTILHNHGFCPPEDLYGTEGQDRENYTDDQNRKSYQE